MNYEQLRKEFHQQVYPAKPNEWDIEDALYDLENLKERQQRMLLQAIHAVWPISHSLSFSFLKEAARLSDDLDRQTLAEWLRRILAQYEEGGLTKARNYMAESDLARLEEENAGGGVRLADYHGRLTNFARGISGIDVTLQGSGSIYTDTETIYLPDEVVASGNSDENLLFYKLLIGIQVCFIRIGSLRMSRLFHPFDAALVEVMPENLSSRIMEFFGSFTKATLAQNLYQLVELSRVVELLKVDYPGLLRDTFRLRSKLCKERIGSRGGSLYPLDVCLIGLILPEQKELSEKSELIRTIQKGDQESSWKELIVEMYAWIENTGIKDDSFSFRPFMDRFMFDEVERATKKRVIENKKKFATVLADILVNENVLDRDDEQPGSTSQSADGARIQITQHSGDQQDKQRASISIDNQSIELSEELLALIENIQADLGSLPQGYVSAAFGIAGRGISAGEGIEEKGRKAAGQFIPYDEWDYRRHGYRKNWCGLRERTLQGVTTDFVKKTVIKHRGVLSRIHRQFEMMRTQERFARRRRHGDDLDLDAVIDSLGDRAAGLAPSEKLFVRLIRDERSISTLFLVDMSNSTEGWIGIAIKEALVLLCEAMETVGDSYGIYGFSGMRRMRSEVYGIKELTERYTDTVRQRIAAITPKEYTRMGPPIRHMIQKFSEMETKRRLLLILSDGKPEDYDDYKGQYAIEDTRKALAEARGRGVHPYCITIDRQAHDYLEHLFGRGNYTYVKKIEQLPSRLTEIYRLLTR